MAAPRVGEYHVVGRGPTAQSYKVEAVQPMGHPYIQNAILSQHKPLMPHVDDEKARRVFAETEAELETEHAADPLVMEGMDIEQRIFAALDAANQAALNQRRVADTKARAQAETEY